MEIFTVALCVVGTGIGPVAYGGESTQGCTGLWQADPCEF